MEHLLSYSLVFIIIIITLRLKLSPASVTTELSQKKKKKVLLLWSSTSGRAELVVKILFPTSFLRIWPGCSLLSAGLMSSCNRKGDHSEVKVPVWG